MRTSRIALVSMAGVLVLAAGGCRAQMASPGPSDATGQTRVSLLTQGRNEFQARQYDQAEATLHRALQEQPDLLAARYFLGRCQYCTKQYEQAAASFNAVVTVQSKSADSWLWLGKSYEALERRQEALAAYQSALKAEPRMDAARSAVIRLGPSKRIAITFDGDPSLAFTTKAMDEAEKYGGKVTFFVIAENLGRKPQVIPLIEKRGHEIGNHSYDHPHLDRCSEAKVRGQLSRTNDIIVKQGGSRPAFMRPPYGDHNALVDRVSKELGMKVVLWDIDPTDWRPGKSGSVVADYVLSHAKPDAVVLLHQGDNTYGVLDRIFSGLHKLGFACVRLDELPRYPQDVGTYPR